MNKLILLKELRQEGFSPLILKAFEKVNREEFIPKEFLQFAYDNNPLPIGQGATISQPYTIAFMLQLLELERLKNKTNIKILEIGSGSGYVLALIDSTIKNVKINDYEIIGLEIIDSLVKKSKKILNSNKKVKIIKKDGSRGYKERVPFDRILVSAAFKEIPSHLFEQLNEGGILVVPVKNSIFRFKKLGGKIEKKEYEGFVFVPVLGE